MIRKLSGMALAVSVLCVSVVFAGPPARPMVISGEALAEGKPLADGTLLKFMIGQFEAESKIMVSEEGMSYARIEIPAYDLDRKEMPGGREGDLVKFISLGAYPLGDMPPIKWKKGQNLQNNFIVKQIIRERPVIVSAGAINDGDKWGLKCTINPIRQKGIDPASVSYRIKWFSITEKSAEQAGDQKQKKSVFMKEAVLNNIKPGAESTAEYKDNAADIRFFRVLLTPVMANGSVGPSVVRDVVPILTTGDI